MVYQPDFFQFSWSLKNHVESEHEGKDVCCTHCNKMFVNSVNLRKHLSQRICLGGSGRILTAPVKQVEPGPVGSDLGEGVQVVRFLVLWDPSDSIETQNPWNMAEVVEQRRKTPCPHCGKTFLRMGNLAKHMDKQTCLKGSVLPAIETPLEMVTEEVVMEEFVIEEMVTEEVVVEEMVMEEMVIVDTYCQSSSAPALSRPEVPMMMRAEEGLHCFWEEDTGLEVLLVQVCGLFLLWPNSYLLCFF